MWQLTITYQNGEAMTRTFLGDLSEVLLFLLDRRHNPRIEAIKIVKQN